MTHPVSKATNSIVSLVQAMGMEKAVAAIKGAPEDQLTAAEKSEVMREIASTQLAGAQETIKTVGLTPEVLALLQQIVSLMGADAPPPEVATPDAVAAPAPVEAAAPPVQAPPGAPPATPEEQEKAGLPPEAKEPPPKTPTTDSLSLAEEQKKAGLPPADTDAPGSKPERDEKLKALQKANKWAWSLQADMGSKEPPKARPIRHF